MHNLITIMMLEFGGRGIYFLQCYQLSNSIVYNIISGVSMGAYDSSLHRFEILRVRKRQKYIYFSCSHPNEVFFFRRNNLYRHDFILNLLNRYIDTRHGCTPLRTNISQRNNFGKLHIYYNNINILFCIAICNYQSWIKIY